MSKIYIFLSYMVVFAKGQERYKAHSPTHEIIWYHLEGACSDSPCHHDPNASEELFWVNFIYSIISKNQNSDHS